MAFVFVRDDVCVFFKGKGREGGGSVHVQGRGRPMALYHVMCELRVVTEMKQRANADATESSDKRIRATVDAGGARFTELAPRGPHPLKTGGKQDGSSNPYRIGALALVFIVDGANAVGLFVMPTNQQTRTAHPRNQTWITSRLPYAGRAWGPLPANHQP